MQGVYGWAYNCSPYGSAGVKCAVCCDGARCKSNHQKPLWPLPRFMEFAHAHSHAPAHDGTRVPPPLRSEATGLKAGCRLSSDFRCAFQPMPSVDASPHGQQL